jgi:hypothetical protein
MSTRHPIVKVISRGVLFVALLVGTTHTDVALAYWNSGGTGTGTAQVAEGHKALRVNQTAQLAAVAPGQPVQTLSGDFDNRNAGAVPVRTVNVSVASVDKAPAASAGTCDATDFDLSQRTMPVHSDVPAGNGTGHWSGATIAFHNKPGVNQNACMGAKVTLRYTTA